jgi:heme exporter protein B
MQGVAAVFLKEVRTEWRTRVALSGVGLFVVGALLLLGLGLKDASVSRLSAGALIWVLALFTAATGLGRAFVQETERGTALVLRLHVLPTDLWLGKFAFNAVLLLVLNALTAPVLLSLLQIGLDTVNVGVLSCVLAMGTLAIAAVFTTMAALVAQTTARGGLLAALAFPVLVPAFQAGLNGTKAALGIGMEGLTKTAWQVATGDIMMLGLYTAAAVTLSLWLFDFIWND